MKTAVIWLSIIFCWHTINNSEIGVFKHEKGADVKYWKIAKHPTQNIVLFCMLHEFRDISKAV